MTKTWFFLGLGSNLGDRLLNLECALSHISASHRIDILKRSSIYESAPVGPVPQQDFLNMVIQVSTSLSPTQLLRQVKSIEMEVGRKPGVRWGPRLLDVDILFWERGFFQTAEFEIPHVEARNRRFVLLPLAEVAADLVAGPDPATVSELLDRCPDKSLVKLYSPDPDYALN